MARRAMEPGNPLPAMACYHAQQCAEKYLKGYLISQLRGFATSTTLSTSRNNA